MTKTESAKYFEYSRQSNVLQINVQ